MLPEHRIPCLACILAVLFSCTEPEPGPTDTVAACIPADADTIMTTRGDYYACLDTTLNDREGCGPNGYPLGYGKKYIDRFLLETYNEVTPAGQAFLEATGICLQNAMNDQVSSDSSCDAVWDIGFSSHPDCYVDSGFCSLEVADALTISAAVDAADRDLPEQQEQVLLVLQRCNEQ